MLLDFIFKISPKIQKERARSILLALSLILLHIRPVEISLKSSESLFKQLGISKALLFNKEPEVFPIRSPRDTIFVLLDGSDAFFKQVCRTTNRIALRSKSIEVSKHDSHENYFVKVYLKEDSKTKYKIHPLRNFQPNSDLFYLTKEVFGSEYRFALSDLFLWNFENRIDISMNNNENAINRLCILLRLFMNIESHYYGLYYYIPLKTGVIRAEPLIFFVLSVLLSAVFDLNLCLNPLMMFVGALSYALCPLSCLFFLQKEFCSVYGLLFAVINFRFSFVYCLILLIMLIKDQIAMYVKIK